MPVEQDTVAVERFDKQNFYLFGFAAGQGDHRLDTFRRVLLQIAADKIDGKTA